MPYLPAIGRSLERLHASWAAAVCLATGLSIAQTTQQHVVIPGNVVNRDGSNLDRYMFGALESRTQLIIDRKHLGPMAKLPIRRIVFRRDGETNPIFPRGLTGGWINLEVIASWTSQDARSPSPGFASNHGPKRVAAYRGAYQVLSSPSLGTGPSLAGFGPAVSPHIVLAAPLLPASSGNLCLEIVNRAHPSRSAPGHWLIDMEESETSPKAVFGRSCWRKGREVPYGALFVSNAAVGGTISCRGIGPVAAPALLILGGSRTDWGGAIKLPLDLTWLGAPGCLLYVSLDYLTPTVLQLDPITRDGRGVIDLPVPNVSHLVGAQIYSQWLFFDPGKNALGMTATNGASVKLAGPGFGIGMVQALDPNATIGRTYVNRSPVLKLSDR